MTHAHFHPGSSHQQQPEVGGVCNRRSLPKFVSLILLLILTAGMLQRTPGRVQATGITLSGSPLRAAVRVRCSFNGKPRSNST